jgi:hypothetical protein
LQWQIHEKEKNKIVKELPYDIMNDKSRILRKCGNEEKKNEEIQVENEKSMINHKKIKNLKIPLDKSVGLKYKIYGKGNNEIERCSITDEMISHYDERSSNYSLTQTLFPMGVTTPSSPSKVPHSPSRHSVSLSSSLSALVYSTSEDDVDVCFFFFLKKKIFKFYCLIFFYYNFPFRFPLSLFFNRRLGNNEKQSFFFNPSKFYVALHIPPILANSKCSLQHLSVINKTPLHYQLPFPLILIPSNNNRNKIIIYNMLLISKEYREMGKLPYLRGLDILPPAMLSSQVNSKSIKGALEGIYEIFCAFISFFHSSFFFYVF